MHVSYVIKFLYGWSCLPHEKRKKKQLSQRAERKIKRWSAAFSIKTLIPLYNLTGEEPKSMNEDHYQDSHHFQLPGGQDATSLIFTSEESTMSSHPDSNSAPPVKEVEKLPLSMHRHWEAIGEDSEHHHLTMQPPTNTTGDTTLTTTQKTQVVGRWHLWRGGEKSCQGMPEQHSLITRRVLLPERGELPLSPSLEGVNLSASR
jgi:hypothetical protein